jgi:REP element-mobilizing transposase RayT
MARPLRIEFPGALYHVTARGNERSAIFRDEADRAQFIDVVGRLPERFGSIIHGYVLMGNHYHLLIETPQPTLSKTMHYLNATYTGHFNRRHERAGHLLQGRYKGLLIQKDNYLLSVSRYIHLNPVRAGMTRKPEEYEWSSYREYIGKRKSMGWLASGWVLGQFSNDAQKARRLYGNFVEEGIGSAGNPFEELKNGLILGSDAFVSKVKGKLSTGTHREIPQSRRLLRPVTCEDVISTVARKFGVEETALIQRGRRGNQERRVCIYLSRTLTDMSNEEIAGYFGIGYTAVSHVTSRLREDIQRNRSLRRAVKELERELLSQE